MEREAITIFCCLKGIQNRLKCDRLHQKINYEVNSVFECMYTRQAWKSKQKHTFAPDTHIQQTQEMNYDGKFYLNYIKMRNSNRNKPLYLKCQKRYIPYVLLINKL